MLMNACHVVAQSSGGNNNRLLDSILAKMSPEDVKQALNQKDIAPKRDFDNFTPLHLACRDGNQYAVKIFLRNGALPHDATSDGKTPLARAQEVLDSTASPSYDKQVFADFAAAVRLKEKRDCLLEIVKDLTNWRTK